MPVTINDNITIGGLTFAINPEDYQIKPKPIKIQRRSRTGKIIETGVKVGSNWKIVREFQISGFTEDQYTDITNLFKTVGILTFVDPLSTSYQVSLNPDGLDWSQTGKDPRRPTFTLSMLEVG